ncbi:hypothetical protein [Candidatus Mycoplasma haematohominis]|uniref:hypothetical protein n=1 Tax=Candidatus Mycoplasma haematohominis TaxID=1494318 RepID=UPI001C0A6ED4|nr:hypothetical protein [Candidatus Mycoplasma haemohominis]
MLTSEAKLTLTISAIGINSSLGVITNELLKVYLWSYEEEEEIMFSDNEELQDSIPIRKKTKTVTSIANTKSTFDPRPSKSSTAPITIAQNKDYSSYSLSHISKHRDKLVSWSKINKNWWNKAYKQREYIIKHQVFTSNFSLEGAYSPKFISKNSSVIYMNQFCDLAYRWPSVFHKHEELFWLTCTVDGKKPNTQPREREIISITKADFPISATEAEEIAYYTLSQSKKTNTKLGNQNMTEEQKQKFVVYEWNRSWWEWSYEQRLEKDKNNEKTLFPLSEKFKNVTSAWGEISYKDTNETSTNLNGLCKEVYEGKLTAKEEIEDAWRYCSDLGEEKPASKPL